MKLMDLYKKIESPINDENLKELVVNCIFSNFHDRYFGLQEVNSQIPKNNRTTEEIYQIGKSKKNLTMKVINNYLKHHPEDLNKSYDELIENIFIIRADNFFNNKDFCKIHSYRETGQHFEETIYDMSVQHRFYLNIDFNSLYKFIDILRDKCNKKNVPYHFKFSNENRSDMLVIYSSTGNLIAYYEMMNEIRQEHPELISDIKKPPILTGVIDGWIGYGYEPGNNISYNQKLSMILHDAITNETKDFLKENKTKFINGIPFVEHVKEKLIKLLRIEQPFLSNEELKIIESNVNNMINEYTRIGTIKPILLYDKTIFTRRDFESFLGKYISKFIGDNENIKNKYINAIKEELEYHHIIADKGCISEETLEEMKKYDKEHSTELESNQPIEVKSNQMITNLYSKINGFINNEDALKEILMMYQKCGGDLYFGQASQTKFHFEDAEKLDKDFHENIVFPIFERKYNLLRKNNPPEFLPVINKFKTFKEAIEFYDLYDEKIQKIEKKIMSMESIKRINNGQEQERIIKELTYNEMKEKYSFDEEKQELYELTYKLYCYFIKIHKSESMGFHVNSQNTYEDYQEREKDDFKFYFNIGLDTYKFARYFQEECHKENINFYYKVAEPGDIMRKRTEKMCVYVSFKNSEKIYKIIKKVMKEHPELNYKKPPIFTGVIDDYIGIGQDRIINSSFNKDIATILEDAIQTFLEKHNLKKVFALDVINKNPELLTDLKNEIIKKAEEYGIDPNTLCTKISDKEKFLKINTTDDNDINSKNSSQDNEKEIVISGIRFTEEQIEGIKNILGRNKK